MRIVMKPHYNFYGGILFVIFFDFLALPFCARAQAQEDVQSLFRQGVSFYKHDQMVEAAEAFGKVLRIDPHHKKATVYLEKKIPDRLAKMKSLRDAASLRELKCAQSQCDKHKRIADNLLNKMEAKRSHEENILKQRRDQAIRERINQLYKKALRAYKAKEYAFSSDLFREILSLDAGHKQAQVYLEKKIPQKMAAVKRSPTR